MSKLNKLETWSDNIDDSLVIGIPVYTQSTAYTVAGRVEKVNWSTACTIEGKPVLIDDVSKYMNNTLLENSIEPPEDPRPVHLYFNRNLPVGYQLPEMKEKLAGLGLPFNIIYCFSWSELSEHMKLNPKTICFHANELQSTSAVEIVNMVHTLAKLLGNSSDITVTVGIDIETDYNIIKDLQKSNIFGIIPTSASFGFEEAIKGCQAQWNHIPYWPKHILEQLPGAKKTQPKAKPGEIKLTPRQEQILNLIKERGASNKVIAKTLNISESTVKLHVGLVLTKFGVKNRTQLALFGKV